MREQVISQKVGNRSGISGKGRSGSVGQRPVRRDRESTETVATRLRALLSYVPLALKFGLVAAILVLVFLGYRAAANASFFQIRNIETRGVVRVSDETIKTLVRQEVGKTGVWRADLQGLSAHLERLPWVRSAIVTRVLPDGIRVRIVERQPRAVVRTAAGRFTWVDDDAVFLGEMSSTDQMPNFFLRGWNEDASAVARDENRERIAKFLELQRDWDKLGLSERVSEVNLGDIRDVRAQLAGDDSQIEVRLGSQDQGNRLPLALDALDKLRQTPRGPYVSYLDVNQGKRVVVGLVSGGHTDAFDSTGDAATDANVVLAPARGGNDKPAAAGTAKNKRAGDRAKKTDQKPT